MTETKSDPRTEPLTNAQLTNLEQAARFSFGADERSRCLINGALSLITEVRRLRQDDAVWEKHGLTQIVTERNEFREEVKRLRLALETEQRAKWAAEQDKQHWQEEAERNELRDELDAIRHAAHMPDDYEHGLPSWINQHLYGKLVLWTDKDGGPIRRSEDIAEVERLRLQVAQLAEALEVAIGTKGDDDSWYAWYAVTLHDILQALIERETVK